MRGYLLTLYVFLAWTPVVQAEQPAKNFADNRIQPQVGAYLQILPKGRGNSKGETGIGFPF